jgi:CheY-like chemotaxis protein
MPTVLLVEDDDTLRYAAERHLTGAGVSVIAVATTMAALKVLEHDSAKSIDVLVTDIVMPSGLAETRPQRAVFLSRRSIGMASLTGSRSTRAAPTPQLSTVTTPRTMLKLSCGSAST